jgi:hypothetical protein
MRDDKVVHLSDRWSLEQLIDVQNRISEQEVSSAIKALDDLNKRLEEALRNDKKNKE